MKTTKTIAFNKSTFTFLGLIFSLLFFSTSFQAQEISIKGIVKGKSEAVTEILSGATVYLKGTNDATSTNRKGEFTFPKKLKKGDVLVVSYLGYKRKQVKITGKTTYLNIVLLEDDKGIASVLIDNETLQAIETLEELIKEVKLQLS